MYKINMKQDQQTALMKAMRVSDKDLDANRRGVLSDDQQRGLRNQHFVTLLFWWFLSILGALPLIFPGRWLPDTPPNGLFCMAVMTFALGMAFWRQFHTGQALREKHVAVITQPIKTSERTVNNYKDYRAIVGDKKFQVSKSVYDWLLEGTTYSFYYIPQTNELLSIELLLTEEEKRRLANDNEKAKRLSEHMQDTAENYLEDDNEQQSLSR